MSLSQRLLAKIRAMVGAGPMDNIDGEKALDNIAKRVVGIHSALLAVQEEREHYRALLCGIAWDFGQNGGHMPDLAVLEWPVDPEPKKPEDKGKVLKIPQMVSLH